MSRDGLVQYVKSQHGRFGCMGAPPVNVDESKVREGCPSLFVWEEVGGPLVDHALNEPLFDAYITLESKRVTGQFLMWWDGDLFGDGVVPACIAFSSRDWCAAKRSLTADHPWWLSYDNDKIVFAPDGMDAFVAFHHDCLELATFRRGARVKRLWKEIMREYNQRMETDN